MTSTETHEELFKGIKGLSMIAHHLFSFILSAIKEDSDYPLIWHFYSYLWDKSKSAGNKKCDVFTKNLAHK